MAKALEDIVVLDLTQVLAGPFAVTILADFGADVIQIEPVEGDYNRRLTASRPVETQRLADWTKRRNRRSITLNLRSPKGKDIFLKLVKQADVVVQNFSPGTMEKLGLGYDRLRESNPEIIYCAMSGFGQTGPYKERLAYDSIIQAASGIMSMTGFPDAPPVRVGPNVADYAGAVYAVIGILLALHYKQRTGKGQMIDCAMFDAMCHWTVHEIGGIIATGKERVGNRHPWAIQDIYETRDGKNLLFAIQTDAQWESFLRLVGKEKLIAEKWDFNTRIQRSEEIYPLAIEWVKGKTLEEAIEELNAVRIPNSAIARAMDLETDRQVLDRQMCNIVEDPVVGAVRGVIGVAPKLSETPGSIDVERGITELSQHTEEILTGLLGYRDEDVAMLKREGVIA
ncbi:MAG: CoA transferase [Dehalococcoidia bacterium]|jgi:crotonobetainyl-CoA:carnitine CoA-transferase CaiB-like acyl-CoA transferase